MKELLKELNDKLNNKGKELKAKEEKLYTDYIKKIEEVCERLTKKYREYKNILIPNPRDRIGFSLGDATIVYSLNANGFVEVKMCYYHINDYKKICIYNWENDEYCRYYIKKAIEGICDLDWERMAKEKIENAILTTLKSKLDKLTAKEEELKKLEERLG